jgi:hypothetical protein
MGLMIAIKNYRFIFSSSPAKVFSIFNPLTLSVMSKIMSASLKDEEELVKQACLQTKGMLYGQSYKNKDDYEAKRQTILQENEEAYRREEQKELDDLFKFDILNTIRFCLEDSGFDLNKRIGGYLIKPPEGFYLPGNLEPTIVPGNNYYIKSKDELSFIKLKRNTDVFNLIQAVYDEQGKKVLKRFEHRPCNKTITTEPDVAYSAINILFCFIKERVHNFSRINAKRNVCSLNDYKKYLDLSKIAPEYFVCEEVEKTMSLTKQAKFKSLMQDALSEFHEDLVYHAEVVLGDTNELIWQFLGSNVWNYYFTRTLNTCFFIEQGEDYRIRQWSKEHGHEFG